MELCIVYIITLFTSMQGALSILQWIFFALTVLSLLAYAINEIVTDGIVRYTARALAALPAKEGRPPSGNRSKEAMSNDLYYYRGWRRVSSKGLALFTPAFLVMLALGLVVSSN